MSRAPTTIKDAFDLFWEAVSPPPPVPPSQYREMRRAFYAGYHQALCSLTNLVGPDSCSEEQGVELLEALHAESIKFAESIKKGEA